ncbi:hypothetical protein C8R45DRAFT_1183650 [Mycena sanguinolenta]|nr:hypothetical protein C8R45DRAFT_1183650 [Mycena sanguinolenta]
MSQLDALLPASTSIFAIHPSLSVSNLPSSVKARATAAAAGSEVHKVALRAELESTSPKYLPFLVPAFSAALDPSQQMPSSLCLASVRHLRVVRAWGGEKPLLGMLHSISARAGVRYGNVTKHKQITILETIDDTAVGALVQAYFRLTGLSDLASYNAIFPNARQDLWSIVWPWVEFLDQYSEALADADANELLDGESRYAGSLQLIRFLHAIETVGKLIDSTAGFYVVIGRAWPHLVHAEDEAGLADVSYCFKLWFSRPDWVSNSLPDLILGTGGTRTDLASLIVSHIKRVLSNPDSTVTEQTVLHLVGILCMVTNESITGHQDPALQQCLVSCGIVAPPTIACRALCRSKQPGVRMELGGLLSALIDQISLAPSISLPRSLRAGLLEILFTSLHRETVYLSLCMLLEHVIIPATVYHSVLTQLQTCLPEVRDRNAKAIFGDVVLKHWKSLLALADSRFPIVVEYNTTALTATRACDDAQCRIIRLKQEFKRCSGCLMADYCSETCQANDWRRCAHRQTCDDLSFRQEEYSSISPKNQSFLRALAHHEYMTRRAEIAQKHLRSKQLYPSEVLCTVFDFTVGTCKVEVGRVNSSVRSRFEFEVERATESGGDIQLHLMKVMDGVQPHMLPFLHLGGMLRVL